MSAELRIFVDAIEAAFGTGREFARILTSTQPANSPAMTFFDLRASPRR